MHSLPPECVSCSHRLGNNCRKSNKFNPSVYHLDSCPIGLWGRLPISTCTVRQGIGRGIVIPGGGIFLRQSWVTLNMIRHFEEKQATGLPNPNWHNLPSNSLPIELWFLPWEDFPSASEQERFAELGVTMIHAEEGYCQQTPVKSSTWNKTIRPAGWQLKVQAVAQSSFDEIIYLDSDCYPVSPNWLSSLVSYSQGGTTPVFLGDIRESHHLCKTWWSPVDSGCFYLKKSTSPWLEEVVSLNGDLNNYVSGFYGDKDTWLQAYVNQWGSPLPPVIPGAEKLPGFVGIYHPIGLVHRTCDKFTTSPPENTPQVSAVPYIPGDELALHFLKGY